MATTCETCLHDFGRSDNLQRHLLKRYRGLPSLPRELCQRCWQWIKGNPHHLGTRHPNGAERPRSSSSISTAWRMHGESGTPHGAAAGVIKVRAVWITSQLMCKRTNLRISTSCC
ncbi:hypothetical protein PHYSODRAFT_339726 [Phytophthora sojae]|uniref:Uncharacterized protein n=1 Tax=Phytophthora sojae (strain P6497) TaxID=1094619 RepID=G5A7E8_PHYSP|nr:hypothetical protein PHYSODRAFT_339726 [Phytophthora sojae]EGZ07827.1 hypothetical protein PHYSODRAFT_339726 [Phytophthora sojae]|eukprot:XP_009535999.1 hypothetical protein PHYSODRAFT_339726 [Phytophthora sojae]